MMPIEIQYVLELLAEPFWRQASSLGCKGLTSHDDSVGDIVFDGLIVKVVRFGQWGEMNSLGGGEPVVEWRV